MAIFPAILPGDVLTLNGNITKAGRYIVLYPDKILHHQSSLFTFDYCIRTDSNKKYEAKAAAIAAGYSIDFFELDPTQKKGTLSRYTTALSWLEHWNASNPGFMSELVHSFSDILEEVSEAVCGLNIDTTAKINKISPAVFSRTHKTKDIAFAFYKILLKRIRADSEIKDRLKALRAIYDMPWEYIAAYVVYLYMYYESLESANLIRKYDMYIPETQAYISNFNIISRNIIYNNPGFFESFCGVSLKANCDIEYNEKDNMAVYIVANTSRISNGVSSVAYNAGWRSENSMHKNTASTKYIDSDIITLNKVFDTPAIRSQSTNGDYYVCTLPEYYWLHRLKELLNSGNGEINVEYKNFYSDKQLIDFAVKQLIQSAKPQSLKDNKTLCIASSIRHKKRLDAILKQHYADCSHNITIMSPVEFLNTHMPIQYVIIREPALIPIFTMIEILDKLNTDRKIKPQKIMFTADPLCFDKRDAYHNILTKKFECSVNLTNEIAKHTLDIALVQHDYSKINCTYEIQ